MTRLQVANMIQSMGLPYAYYSFPTGQAPDLPYIVYHYPESNDLIADNENFQKIETLTIELYSNTKDFTLEGQVEAILKANYIVYDKSEVYVNEEKAFETIYESEVIING